MFSLNLNRRHKVGLFLVLLATGLSLFFEASAKQTAGIVLLGVAVTWLFGSVSLRVLGFVSCSFSCVIGLYVAVSPILEERSSYLMSSAEYDFALAAVRAAVVQASAWVVVSESPSVGKQIQGLPNGTIAKPIPQPPQGFTKDVSPSTQIPRPPKGFLPEPPKIEVQIPAVAQKWLRPMDSPAGYVVVSIPFPGDASETAIMSEFQTKYLLPRPTYSIVAAISSNRMAILGGVVVFALGLLGFAWMLWLNRRTIKASIA